MSFEQSACSSRPPATRAHAWSAPSLSQRLEVLEVFGRGAGRPSHRGGLERRIDGRPYQFARAGSEEQLRQASALVMKRYAWRGYDAEGALRAAHTPGEATFVAHHGLRVDGTLTVRVDGEHRLLAEQLYPEEIVRLRRWRGRVCEFGRLAFDTGVSTLEILGPLFHLGMAFARDHHRCTDLVIEVNPRHVGFYQRCFGFEILGEMRACDRVGAPAVLLRLPLAEAALHAHAHGGKRAGRKSIYPYCLGPEEVPALRRELASFEAARSEDKSGRSRALC